MSLQEKLEEKRNEAADIKANAGSSNSVPELRAEVERLADLILEISEVQKGLVLEQSRKVEADRKKGIV